MQFASRRKAASSRHRLCLSNFVTYGFTALAASTVLALVAPAAEAAPLKVLHGFCDSIIGGCSDGQSPRGRLLKDDAGNLYGTTVFGGAKGTSSSGGIVFELVPNAAKTRWREKVLYNFCTAANCADGSESVAGLIFGNDGHLYGTTEAGGANNQGAVFELIPNAAKTRWREKVIYSFCSAANCSDGQAPAAGLIEDDAGNLFGATIRGGSANNTGIVFELIPNATKTRWREQVIYTFCPTPGASVCPDGANPQAALLMQAGNLYSTTGNGGVNGSGTVFELTPNAAGNRWRERVLYSFCSAADCVDGRFPKSAVIMDAAGDLVGTTALAASSSGTVFELAPNAAKNRWHEKVIYTFCTLANCADGQQPDAGVVIDSAGVIYGTTESGGTGEDGAVFELVPNAAKTRWRERVLHSFGTTGSDGNSPETGLILNDAGNLYGTAASGPGFGKGTVFEVKLH